MTPELEARYADAAKPFYQGGGAISKEETKLKSWRYFLEINSACNLACPTCTKGNRETINGLKYEHETGLMDPVMMGEIIDKIAHENPNAIVFLYGNSEPFLHPRLAECITAVKSFGLRCELSTNLNYIQHVPEVLAAQPDFMIISLSGFTQDVYVRGHAGGNIEKVKANMKVLGTFNQFANPKVKIAVNYHLYNDNRGPDQFGAMEALARECGFEIFVSTARAISMENAVQYCREHDLKSEPFEVQPGRPDFNAMLPPVSQQWRETMDRLRHPPTEARAMYQNHPVSPVCPVGAGSMFTFIRHDGKTSLCACVADRRITVGDYLKTTPDQMIEQRTGHAFCKQCIKYRLNLYFHIVDRDKWD
jgi:MoaA/NifB/PqqE/SkfB family radical SAM enzyme